MDKKTLIFAQGNGFYGCAIVTTDKTVQQVVDAALTLPQCCQPESVDTGTQRALGFDLTGIIEDGDEGGVMVVVDEIEGVDVPEPVVLLDTGSCDADMAVLKAIMDALNK